jgi:hypothetical protein
MLPWNKRYSQYAMETMKKAGFSPAFFIGDNLNQAI